MGRYRLSYVDVAFPYRTFAVMAFDFDIFPVDDVEMSFHRFVVGDTFRVVASNDAVYIVRQANLSLLGHFVVVYDIDNGIRSDQGDFVQFVFFEIISSHFDNAFFPVALAGEVVTDGDAVRETVEFQQVHHFKQLVGRDMVDYGAVFESGYFEFFSVRIHSLVVSEN